MAATPEKPTPPTGWSKASKRRAAAKRRQLPGGRGQGEPVDPKAPCETCGLKGGCDCR